MEKRIGILGSGIVGVTLANGLKDLYSNVAIANRKAVPVDGWGGEVGTYLDVAANSDIIILAVKGSAAEEVITSVKNRISDKTVIDTTNPIADVAPDEGVLNYFTNLNESLMERLQHIAPEANFVKSFNSVGSAFMIKPDFRDGKPTMFICGNSSEAKTEVTELLASIGWEAQDMGGVKSARAIEPLCILWCLPGMLHNEWSHAFKLLKI
jgi:predicted dinucleotide-binding enzyme